MLSQVVFPFALAPLIWFTSSGGTMGTARNHRVTVAVAVLMFGAVIAPNGFLLWTLFVS